jgi:hypothetical protein
MQALACNELLMSTKPTGRHFSFHSDWKSLTRDFSRYSDPTFRCVLSPSPGSVRPMSRFSCRPDISLPDEPPRQDNQNRRQCTVSDQNSTSCSSCDSTHVIDPEHDGSLVHTPLSPLRHDAVQPRTIPTDYASRPLSALPSANLPASRPLGSVSPQLLDSAHLLLSFAGQARTAQTLTEHRGSFITGTNAATPGPTSLTPLADKFLEEQALAARITQQSAPVRARASKKMPDLSLSGLHLLATLLRPPDDAAQANEQLGCKFVRLVRVGPLQVPLAVSTRRHLTPAGVPPCETSVFAFIRGDLDHAYQSRLCYLCGHDRALYKCTPQRWPASHGVDNIESLARYITAMLDADTDARQRRTQ